MTNLNIRLHGYLQQFQKDVAILTKQFNELEPSKQKTLIKAQIALYEAQTCEIIQQFKIFESHKHPVEYDPLLMRTISQTNIKFDIERVKLQTNLSLELKQPVNLQAHKRIITNLKELWDKGQTSTSRSTHYNEYLKKLDAQNTLLENSIVFDSLKARH